MWKQQSISCSPVQKAKSDCYRRSKHMDGQVCYQHSQELHATLAIVGHASPLYLASALCQGCERSYELDMTGSRLIGRLIRQASHLIKLNLIINHCAEIRLEIIPRHPALRASRTSVSTQPRHAARQILVEWACCIQLGNTTCSRELISHTPQALGKDGM